jgi:alpha-L-rhamnosidase
VSQQPAAVGNLLLLTTWCRRLYSAPTFVYHGFRYIRLDFRGEGAIALGDLEVRGLYMHSDVERHGQVAVGNGVSEEGVVLDSIHKMVVQTQRDNIHSIPTDCPQR